MPSLNGEHNRGYGCVVNGRGDLKVNGTAHDVDGVSGKNGFKSMDNKCHVEPIAIVGMALRLPGGINNSQSFWDLLINKKEGRSRIPADRYNVDAFYSKTPKKGTVKSQYGYFLENDLQQLDASFFSMNKIEVERLDPQQRQLLEVVWECMENAGQTQWRGKNTGCFVGVFGEDWLDLNAKDTQNSGLYRITGPGDFVLANRVSYEYDLRGPSMTVKTGCSSSLLSLHLACQALYNGDCSSAIVGGTNLIMSPTMTIAMTEQGVLSPDGRCKTFDVDADGYARAEAVNAVYVKKLSDAIRDGDPIRAVIRATASNCDGKTPGISCPNLESHESMIRHAYEIAQLEDFSETAFVECHGTGTAVGDPLEAQAVANVFGDSGVYIGSVKPNVGHSEGASGITSLIKTVLALEEKTIPPNINFSKPNPKIPFEKRNLKVPLQPIPWPEKSSERAGVNSFGIGGANAHVIIDSAASFVGTAPIREAAARPQLLVFSAKHPDSLSKVVESYREYIKHKPGVLSDLAYTLGARREHLTHRVFSVSRGAEPFEISPVAKLGPSPEVVFVFTGQGAQWAEMGKQLMEEYPSFDKDIRAMDGTLAGLPSPPPWTIRDELLKCQKTSRLQEAEFSQPLCTAIQVAIVNLLRGWGASPAAVVGHSSGEIAAAYTTNAITIEEAIVVAYYRGQVTKTKTRVGGMAAVGMGRDDISPFLIEGVSIACENSPSSVTLSGDIEQLINIMSRLKTERPDVFVRQLRVEMAYHSHHMREFGETYQSLISNLPMNGQPKLPLYSSVTGKAITRPGILNSSYWRQNLESPVLFHSAVNTILTDRPTNKLFLEIGPHSALAGPLRQIFKASGIQASYVPTLVREQNCTDSLLTAVGQLHLHAVPVDFAAMNPDGRVLTDTPIYPWHHETKYWDESRVSRDWRLRKFPPHEILGSRIMEGNEVEPTWRNLLRLDDVPWIQDHKIHDDVVFPCAGYIGMIGEAIRQVTGTKDFALRQLVISTALVLHESEATEMMTSLRPVRLTTTLDSAWYDFTILSYNGSSWTKHCVGQARAGSEHPISTRVIERLPRAVPSPLWYQKMRSMGLNYGTEFQGLTNISASTNGHTATADILDKQRADRSLYQLHPTTVDLCLQLFSVASSKGLPRLFGQLSVPTNIEGLYIRSAPAGLTVEAIASSTSKGSISGDAIATSDGEVVLQIQGLKLSPLVSEHQSKNSDPHAAAQLQWCPDIDLLDPRGLIHPSTGQKSTIRLVEKLTILCVIETHYKLSRLNTGIPHLEKFRSWIDAQNGQAEQGKCAVVEDAPKLAQLSSRDRLALIESVAGELRSTEMAALGVAILRVFESCENIFEGTSEPLEVLIHDDGLTNLYNVMQGLTDSSAFIKLIGQNKPNLKVLEIGAGTGGTTAAMLESLKTSSGERTYSKYSYTDISAGFFVAAKERFKHFQNIDYAVLDITKDPVEQGFEAGSYDLVLATNVLHATPKLSTTLGNVRKLLRPSGRLWLQELCPVTRWINYIMGILPGWWLGGADNRPDEPYISPERWDIELRNTGFSGAGVVVYDNDIPYQTNANMIVTPVARSGSPKRVTLLCNSKTAAVSQLEALLVHEGYGVDHCTLLQEPPPQQDVISLLDLDRPFFDNISAETFENFKRFIDSLKSTGIFWVTKSVQIGCSDPRYALVLGMARTLRSELSVDFATLEIDNLDNISSNTWAVMLKVFAKFHQRNKDSDIDPDFEYALSNGVVNIGRFQKVSLSKQLSMSKESVNKRLEIGTYGLLQTLRWVDQKSSVLTGDQVEIEVRAVGMNFKDIVISMGLVQMRSSGLGCEGSGIVRQVGPAVTDLKAGDRVLFAGDDSFSTRLITSSKLCAKMVDDLSFEDAATMPCVYATVIYSLIDMARLEKDQTVLIHSACGGVGIAAIQICQMIGATIFATVGNDEKVRYLMDNFGIPAHRIFNSRSTSFLPDLMRETNGKGVDAVLNSLSGELLHASWQCVAEFGKMIEIGKRDFEGRAKLSMELFEANRSFIGVDLSRVIKDRPQLCKKLLDKCMDFYRQGSIQPIKPIKLFEAANIEDTFRYMQKGVHIGKIVVKMPRDPSDLQSTAIPKDLTLRPDVSYLLIGGLGGLGRAIATWMVECGARHLIFLSRSAGKSATHNVFLHELETQGCSVQVFSGSVSDKEAVQSIVKGALKPIAGVLQMSMVLRDRGLLQMSHENWEDAVSPKVQGTWNLHEALAGHKLDFFVLFSSMSGIIGQMGQANYAAANTFLDAFTQYRNGQGLPASVLDIGVMEGIGYVSENQSILEQLRSIGAHSLCEQDLLDSLQFAINQPIPPPSAPTNFTHPSQVVLGLRSTIPFSDPRNSLPWKRDARMSLHISLNEADAHSEETTNEDLKVFLSNVAAKPAILMAQSSIDFLAREIGLQLLNFMLRPEEDLDVTLSLPAIGVDSLISIEIRNWFRQRLGLDISVLEIMKSPSIAHLAATSAQRLLAKYNTVLNTDNDTYLVMKAP